MRPEESEVLSSPVLSCAGDGTWRAPCPEPASAREAQAWGFAVKQALLGRPRALGVLAPQDADAHVSAALRMAGLRPLGGLVVLERPATPAPPVGFPGGWSRRTDPPGPAWVPALRVLQDGALDFPELMEHVDVAARIDTLVRHPEHRPEGWFLMEEAGEPAGVLLMDEEGDDAVLSYLAVAARFRGQGFASALFAAALARVPVGIVRCAIDARNTPVRRWVERAGFSEVGRQVLWFVAP